jgi:hypothetical protein
VAVNPILLGIGQFACAENLGASGYDIALLYYTETLGLLSSLKATWYYAASA